MTWNERELRRTAKILLNGITGVNVKEVNRHTKVARTVLQQFMYTDTKTTEFNLERIYMFVWRRLNSHVLENPDTFVAGRRWGSAKVQTEQSEVIN